MPRPRLVCRAVLDDVTHEAYENARGAYMTACGIPAGKAVLYQVGVTHDSPPEIDCMACVALKGRLR